ncbi:MAG TPA: hypothetical protein DEB39_11660 [Planctomycetaceae bacterium]|nr:hypothetical protein [Planctomycetaceae bacterium]
MEVVFRKRIVTPVAAAVFIVATLAVASNRPGFAQDWKPKRETGKKTGTSKILPESSLNTSPESPPNTPETHASPARSDFGAKRQAVSYIPYETPESRNWVPESAACSAILRMPSPLRDVERRSYERHVGPGYASTGNVSTGNVSTGHVSTGHTAADPGQETIFLVEGVDEKGTDEKGKEAKKTGVIRPVDYDSRETGKSDRVQTIPDAPPVAATSPADSQYAIVYGETVIGPRYSGDYREWAERLSVSSAYPGAAYPGAAPAVGDGRSWSPIGGSESSRAGEPRAGEPRAEGRSVSVPLSPRACITPVLDLAPSYTQHLPYTQVCGAVVCQSNFPFSESGSLLDEIDSLQVDLTDYLGIPEPREKIELCLFRDEKTYIDFLRKVFPDAPRDRRALYVKMQGEPGTLLVQRTGDFEIDLRHEMTHAIIHAGIDNVPIWLDEGLAKYFEPKPENRPRGNPYMKPIARNNMFGIIPNMERLEKLEHIGDMGPKEYRDSWAWVHFMVHFSPETHHLLAGYLQMLGTLPPDRKTPPTLSGYLKGRIDNPRSAYGTHFKKWSR